jgi:hypothetical protein
MVGDSFWGGVGITTAPVPLVPWITIWHVNGPGSIHFLYKQPFRLFPLFFNLFPHPFLLEEGASVFRDTSWGIWKI